MKSSLFGDLENQTLEVPCRCVGLPTKTAVLPGIWTFSASQTNVPPFLLKAMDLIRYRPGEAIRWLQTGAQKSRKDAKVMTRSLMPPEDIRMLAQNVKSAAGALVAVGRGALADLMHHQAAASEYVLGEADFEVIKPGSAKRFHYAEVKAIAIVGDRYLLKMDRTEITIKPYAYVVAGRLKVPVGWSRNGIEVPYELLLDELAARCHVEPD